MYIKPEKLKKLIAELGWTNEEFAEECNIRLSELEKMLRGEPVGVNTARAFIYYLKAEIAQYYIDWGKTGVENPLTKPFEEDKDNE